jgi:ABC-type uncharacterized transport system involved in gliding motility auxiliary subunit
VKRYLAIPGCLLLVAALIRATVNAHWDAPNIWLAAAGTLIIGVTVVWNWQEVVEWLRDPRGIFAVTTGISVAAFVAVLVMVNIAVWYNPWAVDLTASGRNEVSDDTRRILGRLEASVELVQFGRDPNPRVEQLLRSFERETPRIRVEFVDSDRQVDLARQYGVLRNGAVVVRSGEKFRKVDEPNEQALVTAVLQATTAEDRVVCFVTGHGERGITDTSSGGLGNLAATLEASNYKAERISLLEGDVPASCAAVVMAGPRQPYEQAELDRLRSYGDRWGRIAVLLEPDPAPSFAEWLRPRGLDPLPGVIVDTSNAGRTVGSGPRSPLAVRYVAHPITQGFEIATLYDGARPLQTIDMPEFGGKPTALAETGRESFATTASDATSLVTGRDKAGPLTLAAATTIGNGRRTEQELRIVVFGDSDFISNAYLRRQGNRDFFLRSIAWLLGEEEATIVAVDPRDNRRLELTEQTRAWMYLVNLGLLPLIPLSAGILMFIRSRR